MVSVISVVPVVVGSIGMVSMVSIGMSMVTISIMVTIESTSIGISSGISGPLAQMVTISVSMSIRSVGISMMTGISKMTISVMTVSVMAVSIVTISMVTIVSISNSGCVSISISGDSGHKGESNKSELHFLKNL